MKKNIILLLFLNLSARGNNIIVFPDESRELVFDTKNAFSYPLFHGTSLHKLCLERGYITNEFNPGSLNVDIPLGMPQLSREEIDGLRIKELTE